MSLSTVTLRNKAKLKQNGYKKLTKVGKSEVLMIESTWLGITVAALGTKTGILDMMSMTLSF